jgi:hypothetical protein
VADGRDLREPLGRGKLRDLVPVFEDQLKVTAWHSDAQSEDFGKPAMWQYRLRAVVQGDQQGRPDQWADVHPSRIVVMAEAPSATTSSTACRCCGPGTTAWSTWRRSTAAAPRAT